MRASDLCLSNRDEQALGAMISHQSSFTSTERSHGYESRKPRSDEYRRVRALARGCGSLFHPRFNATGRELQSVTQIS